MFQCNVFNFISIIIIIVCKNNSKSVNNEKTEFCSKLTCDVNEINSLSVCGKKKYGDSYQFKLFKNKCELLKYDCRVETENEYGLVQIEKCNQSLKDNFIKTTDTDHNEYKGGFDNHCKNDCNSTDSELCGIRLDGTGYRIRIFQNECHLLKYNCENNLDFRITEYFICNSINSKVNIHEVRYETETNKNASNLKNLIIVDGSFLSFKNDINNTIDDFFAFTHVFDLPMMELDKDSLNETSRRMLIKIAGPVKVFKPWITIPKNISDDYYHRPTLSSCYHKCPKKCPDTYAPVCGVPGIVAREPSLMFKNHCFMDVAQCKMYWENKSPTALSSSYIESSFLFCLGDQLNGLYRFLPLIKTLQHMGRLKKKGRFRYKLSNMRFFNNFLSREPKLMG